MVKRRSAVLVIAILAAACAPGDTSETSVEPGSSTTSSGSPDTTSGDEPTTTLGGETTSTASGREVAPDFTLALGDGGTYSLSEGAKPVYLVFWAEW